MSLPINDREIERELSITVGIATLFAENGPLNISLQQCIELLVRELEFEIGQFWMVESDQETITCSDIWFSKIPAAEFRRASLERKLSKGAGLPGRILGMGTVIYAPLLSAEMATTFTRKDVALKCGLVSGMGFPVKTATTAIGVLEFFSTYPRSERIGEMRFLDRLGNILAVLMELKSEQESNKEVTIESGSTKRNPQGLIAVDASGTIIELSKNAEKIIGWNREESAGKALSDLIIPQRFRQQHNAGFARLTAASTVTLNRVIQAPALRKDGTEIMLSLRLLSIGTDEAPCFATIIGMLNQETARA